MLVINCNQSQRWDIKILLQSGPAKSGTMDFKASLLIKWTALLSLQAAHKQSFVSLFIGRTCLVPL